MPGNYAKDTEVSVDRSLAEIRRTLRAYDGDAQIAFVEKKGIAVVEFVARGRRIRFVLDLPDIYDRKFWKTPTGRDRSDSAAEAEYERAVRRVYRVFAFVIKAKLEAVESGLVTFESEFLAQTVLPGGTTVGDEVGPKVDQACASGNTPELLPDYARRAITSGGR